MSDPESKPRFDPKDATQLRGSSQRKVLTSTEDPPTVVQSSTKISSTPAGSGSSGTHDSGETHRNEQMPAAGTRIGIYELGPPIGIGGMATVYAAQDLSLERTVALKILPPKSSQDNEVLQRFILEGKAAAQLDHPNIARIHALGHDGSYYFLAFEYVEGRTVRQWIEDRGQIEIDQVLNWSIQVSEALAHADRRGVVHRDIKPSNLIVTPGNQIKLVDLGLARRYETQGHVELTQSGVTLGTFDYISPEQARDPRNVDIRSDLYSLGCTIFHMVSGQPPFPGQNVVQKLLQHQEKSPPDLRNFVQDVPEALADLVKRLMAKTPSDRPSSADLCASEFRKIVDSRQPKTGPLKESEVDPNSLKGLMMWLVPALLMAGMVTTGAWYFDDNRISGPVSAALPEMNKSGKGISPEQADSLNSKPIETEQPPGAIVPVPLETGPTQRFTQGLAIQAETGEQLIKALRESTPGSVITLTQAGPYLMSLDQIPELVNTDLTIKAAIGIRPSIQPVIPQETLEQIENQGPATAQLRLLNFRESRVQIQGLTFDLRGSSGSVPVSAVHVEECDLLLRDNRFLTDHAALADLSAFVQIRKKQNQDKFGWRPVRVENCRFWGPRIAMRASGPIDLSVLETASISSEPLVWIDQSDDDSLWPCKVELDQVSVMATGWTPILELNNAAARIRTQNSLFAPSPGGQISLVSSRRPSRLDWFGRGNVYGEVTRFLESTRFDEEVLDFESWSRTGGVQREQKSLSTKQSVFSPVDSAVLAAQGRWSDAFALNRGPWTSMSAGVQSWSESTILQPPVLLAENQNNGIGFNTSDPIQIPPKPAAELTKPIRVPPEISSLPDETQVAIPPPMPMPMPMPMQVDTPGNRVETATIGGTRGVLRSENGIPPDRTTNNINTPLTVDSGRNFLGLGNRLGNTTEKPDSRKTNQPETPFFRNVTDSSSLISALKDDSNTGGTLTITGVRELNVDQAIRTESGKWQIGNEPGSPRPLIRFKRRRLAPAESEARWYVGQGTVLKFRGVDIYWESDEPVQSRLFEVAAGAQIVFEDCTLTMKGQREDLVMFSMTPSNADAFDETASQKASVRLIDSIVRTAGGLFRVRSDVRSDLELTGSLCLTGSPLITITSSSKLETLQTSKLQLNQTTAVLGSSLASVSLGRGPVDSPALSLQTRRSIIATDPQRDRSLIDVRGVDPNQLNEEAVTWDGDEVGYHQWQTYRTDQNDLSGMSIRRQNREDWQLNNAENDTQPVHGDLGFERDFWSIGRPYWQAVPADFLVRDSGPGQGLGFKFDRLPQVPGPFSDQEDFPINSFP